MRMANVNEVELIGKIVKNVETLKTRGGKPYVKMQIETERFVIAKGKKERLSQVHTVLVLNSLSVPVMSEYATPGTIVRVVGELAYQGNAAEIHVLEYLGQASLMAFPVDQQDAPAKAPAKEEPAKRQGSGGLGRIAQSHNEDDDQAPDVREAEQPKTADAIFDGPNFQGSEGFDDDIPF